MTLHMLHADEQSAEPYWEWDGFEQGPSSCILVKGYHIELLNPEVSVMKDGKEKGKKRLAFQSAKLRGDNTVLCEHLQNRFALLPTISHTSTFPYCSTDNEACFAVISFKNHMAEEARQHHCHLCTSVNTKDWEAPKPLKHSGAHILWDP